MQQVTRSLEKKSGKLFWISGLLGLLFGMAGLVTAYYYSWRLTAPGLPVEMRPSYESMAKNIGLVSLSMSLISLVLIGFGFWRWYKNRSAAEHA
jgi:membrane-anchored protein YejM (alkaline phosphatase superfamily)